jgi:glycosyltransferase involved in cell wall biosynthesis
VTAADSGVRTVRRTELPSALGLEHSRPEPTTPRQPLVSIVIPCFNQAHFLGDAIRSALAQIYRPIEVIVVDDGSTDDTAQVASRYDWVHLVRQANSGLSAARNTGLRASRGELLVFLDADDRLLPEAVEIGARYLDDKPECAFVSGHYRDIDAAGSVLAEWPHRCVQEDHYLELLREPYIAMHATVLFRRGTLERVGAFDTSLRACEDYDVYLRVARQYPVGCHASLIAEYRQHATNMTRDPGLMMRSVKTVLTREWPHVRSDERHVRAYRLGLCFWRRYYGRLLARDLEAAVVGRRWRHAAGDFVTLLRYYPWGILKGASLIIGTARSAALHAIAGPLLVRTHVTRPDTPTVTDGTPR